MRVIELKSVDNVRDLGGIPVAEGRIVKPGIFYRGSALTALNDVDRQMLFDTLGISCVIDLRCGWELEAKPNVKVPEIEYLHIPFYDLEKVGIDYTHIAPGTKMVGHDFACEPDHFYRSLANRLTVQQMRKCIDESFSRALTGRAIYHHCSGGKDRAGILSLLILTVLGAKRDAILDDYLITNISRDKKYSEIFERFLRLTQGDEERAHELTRSHSARPENLDAFYEAIESRYGDMDSFVFYQLGIDEERLCLLRKTFTCEVD